MGSQLACFQVLEGNCEMFFARNFEISTSSVVLWVYSDRMLIAGNRLAEVILFEIDVSKVLVEGACWPKFYRTPDQRDGGFEVSLPGCDYPQQMPGIRVVRLLCQNPSKAGCAVLKAPGAAVLDSFGKLW